MSTVTAICAWASCGKPFTARVADRKRGWAKTCSKACAAKLREKTLDRFSFQRGAPGTFASRRAGYADEGGETEFSDAHLFSNEEHDCSKE